MSRKKIKQPVSDLTAPPVQSFHKKILPIKRTYFTFHSDYDEECDYKEEVQQIRLLNPKWCNLYLKLGHVSEYKKLSSLRRAKSLRLRSLHLSNYHVDSQGDGDEVNRYSGEFDVLARAGHTLQKLSLSVAHDLKGPREVVKKRSEAYFRLKKFVKKQKHLEEFRVYMGSPESSKYMINLPGRHGGPKWMDDLLVYMEKTVKTLTLENLSVDNVFKRHGFSKLETLRFEYILFYRNKDSFDFSIVERALPDILAIPSLKNICFSHYHRLHYETYLTEDRDLCEIEPVKEFWKVFRTELNKYKDKQLKIKYHKNEEGEIEERVEEFKRIFKGLPPGQTFEYEVAGDDGDDDEDEDEEGEGEEEEEDFMNEGEEDEEYEDEKDEDEEDEEDGKGVRYLFYLNKVEKILTKVSNSKQGSKGIN